MSFIIDVVTVIIFISIVFHAYRKGFIRTLIEFVGTILSYVVAYKLSFPFGNWIDGNFINKFVNNEVGNNVKYATGSSSGLFSNFFGSIPQSVTKIFTQAGDTFTAKATDSVVSAVSAPVSLFISRCIAFFVILAVCFFLLRLLSHLFVGVRRIPLIGKLNSLAGALIGILEAIVVLFIFCMILDFVISLETLGGHSFITSDVINATHIFKYINEANPLTGMLLKV